MFFLNLIFSFSFQHKNWFFFYKIIFAWFGHQIEIFFFIKLKAQTQLLFNSKFTSLYLVCSVQFQRCEWIKLPFAFWLYTLVLPLWAPHNFFFRSCRHTYCYVVQTFTFFPFLQSIHTVKWKKHSYTRSGKHVYLYLFECSIHGRSHTHIQRNECS